MKTKRAVFGLLLATIATQVRAEDGRDWTMTRGGPELSGQVGFELPIKPDVLWSYQAEGSILGEAVVSEGMVVFGDSTGQLVALELGTGKEKWKKKFEAGFSAGAAIDGGMLFIGGDDGFLYALDLKTAEQKWSFETGDKISAAVNLFHPKDGGETWVVMNGYDGVCRVFEAKTGKKIWKFETDSPINGTPAIVAEKWVVFGGCDHFLYALDLKTGKEHQKIPGEAPIVSTVGTEGGFVAWGDHSNQVMGALVDGGQKVWSYKDRNFPFMAAPAVDRDRIYVGGRDKKIHAISRSDGKGVWQFRTGGRVESSPILFKDGLLVGSSDGRLYALSLDSGEEIWRVDLGESLVAAPAFARGMILIGSENGTLFALGKK